MTPRPASRKWLYALVAICIWLAAAPAAAADVADVDDYILDMEVAYNLLNNYRCRVVERAWGGRDSLLVYSYYFQKPNRIRVEIESGPRKGDVLFYLGKDVWVRRGSPLFLSPHSYSPEDPRVCFFIGGGILQTGLVGVIDRVKGYLAQATIRPVPAEANGQYCLAFRPRPGSTGLNFTEERLWLDSGRLLPLRLVSYRESRPVEEIGFRDLAIDQGLEDGLFEP